MRAVSRTALLQSPCAVADHLSDGLAGTAVWVAQAKRKTHLVLWLLRPC